MRRLKLTLFFQSNKKSWEFLGINLQSNSFNSVGAVFSFWLRSYEITFKQPVRLLSSTVEITKTIASFHLKLEQANS